MDDLSMNDSEAWATGFWGVEMLTYRKTYPGCDNDASLLVQLVTKNILICEGPTEFFSAPPPPPANENAVSIFELFGRYLPSIKSIEIYDRRIKQRSGQYGAEYEELLEIIRIHEYAHAIVHIGLDKFEFDILMPAYGKSQRTEWNTFNNNRNDAFSSIDEQSHEFLAQAITLSSIQRISTGINCPKLLNVFYRLMESQPDMYKIPQDLLSKIPLSNFSLILKAARGHHGHVRGPHFSLKEGLTRLVHLTSQRPFF